MQLLKNINAKELAGLLTLVACFGFISFAMYVEPTGQIHDSVNLLVGELLIFSGTCFDLDYFAHRSSHKQMNSSQPRKKREPNQNEQR